MPKPLRPSFASCALRGGIVAASALVLASATAAAAQQAPLEVGIHQVSQVRLNAAAGSVIVANPNIADVTVTDARTLFITGKDYGVTQVVAVDALGRPLFQRQVVVAPAANNAVRVWRGGAATEVACGSTCAPAPRTPSAP